MAVHPRSAAPLLGGPGRTRPGMLLALALLLGPLSHSVTADDEPRLLLHAELWRREVVFGEPILLRVELTNTGAEPIDVVPPYPWALGTPGALTIAVTDSNGADVPRQPRDSDYRPWGLSDLSRHDVPVYRWALAPGGTGFFWFDLLGLMTLNVEGEFRVHLAYTADAAGIARTTPIQAGTGVWEGQLQADAGVVRVRAPSGPDAPAFEVMGGTGTGHHTVLSSADRLLSWKITSGHPTSRYVPYARYYAIEEAVQGPEMAAMPQTEPELWLFATDYPDFVFAYRLPFWREFREWSVARFSTDPAWAVDPDPAVVAHAGAELVAAAEACGDREVLQRARTAVWQYERWRARTEQVRRERQEAAAAGTEP